ncbi:ComF family protein [Kaistella flava (ex Peng et al. 2021)]|uniref:ComF family protein n=1 Tax=Kaistella flava (ex Peng et al. 2021) TaxID=2038776 RepID=A0A7M2Y5H8_9FLAO|nr:phosphoribosyltransferase family protein [Kaistella flava (ex Peng et al. 2021)]QOW08904.1 ComF family protein [Kaistella flava (ex Peng et al. 2021)]
MFLVDLLFPNRCLECNRIIHHNEVVCELCFDQINFTHHHFSESNLLTEKCRLLFPIENAFALMQFEEESTSQKIIHQLKYGGREKIGKIISNWTLEKIDLRKSKIDLLVTIPLHPTKQKERGYNQLHLFADTLSKGLKIPCDHSLIKRNFYKKAQAQKRREQRTFNENLFSITKNISNQHILLIDDVFTTGNTMSAVAWQILKEGNNKVSVLVMAID